ncbi:popeye domain-containing protein 3-like isoform X2 [Bacillus rossius redtenbacheri]|uniref:popeye domain-containing protein 3-like isoform X2 n=1 Tax=Bacillus rossius redtenbacheri TaxID=93214 RepID=UPI002FDDD6CC
MTFQHTVPLEATAKSYLITTSVEDYWSTSYAISSQSTSLNVVAENTTYEVPKQEVKFCEEWEAAQHNLFQTANIFFAAAFLVPRNFRQSLLLLRSLLSVGFVLSTLWAGIHVCAPDAFAWNVVLVFLNTAHTLILTCRILPPPLSIELTELYLKVFRPLRVSKKHFKELSKEGVMMNLESGGTYALQDVTPADEKLSILLKGKLKVTCDSMLLHYIYPHQFIDSPEWEANFENSHNVFQVTITAEEDCLYICWSRAKLERVFRHRHLLKVVFSNIIGLSPSFNKQSFWVPMVAKQFPATSPFSSYTRTTNTGAFVPTTPQLQPPSSLVPVTALPLGVPSFTAPVSPSRNNSNPRTEAAFRSSDTKEIKFETPV